MKPARVERQILVDVLKLVAAQLVVLHHFASYGPLAQVLDKALPALSDWLFHDARMAVQIFLVLGGYLAVRSFSRAAHAGQRSPWRAILLRYGRLVLPLLAALLLAVASAALARQGLDDDFIPGAPNWAQLLSHVVLFQDLLGYDALSAGVWYVAIDFQLFAITTLLLWQGRNPRQTQALLLGLMLASLYFFNLDDDWSNSALYFFGAYGLGAAAFWAGNSRHALRYLSALAAVGLMALALDFRERIGLALAVALLLGWWQWRQTTSTSRRVDWPAWLVQRVSLLGKTSYALFLVHFSVLMLGNALFVYLGLNSAGAALLVLLASWAACLGLAVVFEHWVEAPLARLGQGRTLVKLTPEAL